MKIIKTGEHSYCLIPDANDPVTPRVPAEDDPLWQGSITDHRSFGIYRPIYREDKCEDGVHRLYEACP